MNEDKGKINIINILIVCLLIFAVWKLIFTDSTDYTKPWFNGKNYAEVCEVQVDDNDNCYFLYVISNQEEIYRVEFPNGGYLLGKSFCHKSAWEWENVKRFCRFYPTNKDTSGYYDISPLEEEWQINR